MLIADGESIKSGVFKCKINTYTEKVIWKISLTITVVKVENVFKGTQFNRLKKKAQ